MTQHHERRLPGESDEYRRARNELLQAEMALRAKVEEVAALRRKLPDGGKLQQDYEFDEVNASTGNITKTRLSGLFENGDALIVYGFMYGPDWDEPCPMCTSIADGTNGIAPHVRAATNLVFVAKAPAERMAKLAKKRGWKDLRILSSYENTFNRDYYAEYDGEHGNHHPMINVFVRRDDGIRHFWTSELFFVPEEGMQPRHADMIWPLWNFLDLTPGGRANFMPQLDYDPG